MKILEKQLKRYLKRKFKINLSLLVIFLITGQLGYSLETEDWINDKIINSPINILSQKNNIINNGTINSKKVNQINSSGISITNQYNLINIINNGIISNKNSSENQLCNAENGISNYNDKYILNNNGVIISFATSNSFDSGNGILNITLKNSTDNTSNIINKGHISGKVFSSSPGSGNGIFNSSSYSSNIDNILNSGNILGTSHNSESDLAAFFSLGNGIINESRNSNISQIINNGIIKGTSTTKYSYHSGNGISNISTYSSESQNIIKNIKNNGIISGNYLLDYRGDLSLGNGILSLSHHDSFINYIYNKGVIHGYSLRNDFATGSGITNYADNKGSIKNINNSGLISGSNSAISSFLSYNMKLGNIENINNFGVLAGKNIIIGNIINFYNNYGIEVLLDNNFKIKSIINGNSGNIVINNDKKLVINGTENGNISNASQEIQNDSYVLASNLLNNKDLIINGAGINTGALVIDKNTNIDDSIINGYETAVYLKGENGLQATNTTFNGGGLKNDIAVIVGDNDNNTISILGNSVINGDVNLGNGNDNLSISISTQINGDLIGGIGKDTLDFTNSNTQLNIYNNISEFENLNINGNTTLFETSKITGAENINLASEILTLRIDPTKKDSNGKVIGHSLYENNGVINSSGGTLALSLNGLGKDTIISMGETSINPSLDTNYIDTDKLIVTNSIILDAKLIKNTNGKEISIEVLDKLPIDPASIKSELYEDLNISYTSIIDSGEAEKLANTTYYDITSKKTLSRAATPPSKTYDEAMAGLFEILNQLNNNTPYTYTLKSSRDSLKLFEDNMSYLTIKPNNNEWIVQGKAIYTGVKNDNDVNHRNYKTTTNTIGGLATFEYGLSDKSSLGLVFGGNNQDVSFRGSNSIDGNSLYVGSFIKTEKNQFKFMTSLGYQYTSNDVDRSVSNQYDSFKTDEKYDVNSLNAFIEGKYSINVDNQWIMEPKVKLSYYFVNQDKVDEGYSADQLSIGVDKFTTNTGDIEVGFDLKKEVLYSKGKLNNILSFGVINTIGSKDEDLKAHIIGKEVNGSKFDIQGVELPTTSGKVAYNMEFEQPNGMIYSAGVNFEFAKDNNRNVNATLGLGYRF